MNNNLNENNNINNSNNMTSMNGMNNSNNFNNMNNNKNNDTIKIVAIIACALVVLLGGYFVYNQIKLKKVDKTLSDEAKHINDGFNTDTNTSTNSSTSTKSVSVGENVTLVDGSSWYVLSQSGDKVTLLSSKNYGSQTYFSAKANVYSESLVKERIDNEFLPELKTSLSKNGGNVSNLTARIITIDEIRKVVGDNTSADNKIDISSNYNWLCNTGSYWTMTVTQDSNNSSVYVVESWGMSGNTNVDIAGLGLNSGNKFNVRPVIETTIENIK